MQEEGLVLECEPASLREEEISASLMHLKRNVALYPMEHAAVRRSLENVRSQLKACFEATGKPFVLATQEAPQAEDKPKRRGSGDAPLLRRLLRRHLVSEVTLLPEVTDEELCQFCYLLREERFRRDGSGKLPFDPASWEHILLEFYRPGSLEEVADEGLMEAFANATLEVSLEPWLQKLPPDRRARAQELLRRREFLSEIHGLRTALRKIAASKAAGAEERDLVRELLAIASPPPEASEDLEAGVRSLLGTLRSFVEFLRANSELFASPRTAAAGARLDVKTLLEKFAHAQSGANPLLDEAERLKSERRRLAFLFRTFEDSEKKESPAPVRPEPQVATPSSGAPSAGNATDPAATLVESGFRGIEYDLRALRERLSSPGSLLDYVTIALELLRDPARKEFLSKHWERIAKAVGTGLGRSRCAEAIVDRILDFLEEGSAGAEAERLLVVVLDAMPSLEDAARAFERMVFPRTGKEVSERVLVELSKYNRPRTTKVLAALAKGGGPAAGAAVSLLVQWASDPSFLAEWALEDPTCVAKPAVSKIIQKTPGERLREAFRGLFVIMPAERAETLLNSLPSGVEGVDEIVAAALASSSSAVRRAAMEQVPKFPSPRFIGFLKVVIDRNNRGPLCLPEVKAAIDALRSIQDPDARRVLEEIDRARRFFFRHAYRKEIRKALHSVKGETV